MSRDHTALLQVQQVLADSGQLTHKLLGDLKVILTPAIHLLFLCFESDRYSPTSEAGRNWLRGLLHTLPDSKIVEDCHGVLRKSLKNRVNKRQTMHSFQELVVNSGVLEERNISHKPFVDRDVFLEKFARTKDVKRKRLGSLLG